VTNPRNVPSEQPQVLAETDDASSPHDALFYLTFSKPEHAGPLLRELLDKRISDCIAWDTLALKSPKFVDAKLTGRYADVLYTVRMRGLETLIYALLEHKSQPERWTLLQIAEQKVRIWRDYLNAEENQGKNRLPVILAVVVHHGERGWSSPVRFREYFDVADEDLDVLAPHLLDFRVLLDDLVKRSGEAIVQRQMTVTAQLTLLALRFGRWPDLFFVHLHLLAPKLQQLHEHEHGRLVIAAIIVYLKTVSKYSEAEVRRAMQEVIGISVADEIAHPERRLEIIERRAELRGERRGERRGELRGERRGELSGRQSVLKRLLAHKFGPLSLDATTCIDKASAAELDAMALRVLTAATLEEALGKPQAR
jgi:predicted transposase YdaD